MATLNNEARTYLIAQGVVRDPRTAGSLPPAWRQPVDGVKAPNEGTGVEVGPTAVVGMFHTGGIARPRFEKEWRRDILDFYLRTTTWPVAETLYKAITDALIDKRNWTMGSMVIIESLEWRSHQLLESDAAQGFTSHFAVLFETYAVAHT